MFDRCNILLTASGHLVVESLDGMLHVWLAQEREYAGTLKHERLHRQRADSLRDFVPSNEFNQGMGYTAYPFWCSYSV